MLTFHGSLLIWLLQNNKVCPCTAGESHEPPAVPIARPSTVFICLIFSIQLPWLKKKKCVLSIQTTSVSFSIKILSKTKHTVCFKWDERLGEFCFVLLYLPCGCCTLESGQWPETGNIYIAECCFLQSSHPPVPSSNLSIIKHPRYKVFT